MIAKMWILIIFEVQVHE